jgi:hypothetical protein
MVQKKYLTTSAEQQALPASTPTRPKLRDQDCLSPATDTGESSEEDERETRSSPTVRVKFEEPGPLGVRFVNYCGQAQVPAAPSARVGQVPMSAEIDENSRHGPLAAAGVSAGALMLHSCLAGEGAQTRHASNPAPAPTEPRTGPHRRGCHPGCWYAVPERGSRASLSFSFSSMHS